MRYVVPFLLGRFIRKQQEKFYQQQSGNDHRQEEEGKVRVKTQPNNQKKNDDDGVVRVLRRAEEVLPFDVIPATTSRLPLYFGQLYELAGNEGELMRLGKIAYEQYPQDNYVVGTYVSLLEREERYEEAIQILEHWQKEFPSDPEAKKKIMNLRNRMSAQDSILN